MSRPRIGVNCDVGTDSQKREVLKLLWPYADAVLRAGGLPLILAPQAEEAVAEASLDAVDGLLLTGGRDYAPSVYGQEPHEATRCVAARRGEWDLLLARRALERGVPVLGVCGGAQLINIALGGTLVQHVPDVFGDGVCHSPQAGARAFHMVEAEAGSRLAGIVGATRFEVNSSHHQAADRVGAGLRLAARAPDGVPEALEAMGEGFVLAVQWHPERLLDRPEHLALFRALVDAAGS
jgi:putative glutamine amidotransferase